MSDQIKITCTEKEVAKPQLIFLGFLGLFSIFTIGIVVFFGFVYKSSDSLFAEPAIILQKEIKQTLDETIALKMALIKTKASMEEQLLKMQETQKRQEANSLSLSSFVQEMNKRITSLEILPASLSSSGNTKNVDWDTLVKKHLASSPSTEAREWAEVSLENISASLKNIDQLLSIKGGSLDIVTGETLSNFFKTLPQPLVFIYGDTLWPSQGQLTRGFVQNIWRTETIREIQRRAVLRALGKDTN